LDRLEQHGRDPRDTKPGVDWFLFALRAGRGRAVQAQRNTAGAAAFMQITPTSSRHATNASADSVSFHRSKSKLPSIPFHPVLSVARYVADTPHRFEGGLQLEHLCSEFLPLSSKARLLQLALPVSLQILLSSSRPSSSSSSSRDLGLLRPPWLAKLLQTLVSSRPPRRQKERPCGCGMSFAAQVSLL
jgi:hypothetical protein